MAYDHSCSHCAALIFSADQPFYVVARCQRCGASTHFQPAPPPPVAPFMPYFPTMQASPPAIANVAPQAPAPPAPAPIPTGLKVLGGLGLVALAIAAGRAFASDGEPNGDDEPEWQTAERETCFRRGETHDGRSGRADCVARNGNTTDVKHYARPVDASVVRRSASSSWRGRNHTIVSTKGGFTRGAFVVASRMRVTLSTE